MGIAELGGLSTLVTDGEGALDGTAAFAVAGLSPARTGAARASASGGGGGQGFGGALTGTGALALRPGSAAQQKGSTDVWSLRNDPLEYLRRYGDRYWSFHIKDVPRLGATRRQPQQLQQA